MKTRLRRILHGSKVVAAKDIGFDFDTADHYCVSGLAALKMIGLRFWAQRRKRYGIFYQSIVTGFVNGQSGDINKFSKYGYATLIFRTNQNIVATFKDGWEPGRVTRFKFVKSQIEARKIPKVNSFPKRFPRFFMITSYIFSKILILRCLLAA